MAITSAPLQSQSPAAGLTAPSGANPLTLPTIAAPTTTGASLSGSMNPSGVINTLANNAPQSLTSLLMPLYSQLFGAQTGALAQSTNLSTQQNVAQAQSGAQQRGLTGSSIEAGAMQGATAAGQNAYTQGYASLLGNYVGQYANAASSDVNNQQTYYGNLAQALGQGYNSSVEQSQFEQQLANSSSAASSYANATQNAGIFGALGSIGGGLGLGAMLSDIRLKKNVRQIGTKFGLKVYAYEYDRDRCPALRGKMPGGTFIGFMAHHVLDRYPAAVRVVKGYLMLDYNKLAELILA